MKPITITINNQFTRLTSTGLRGDTLLRHFCDGVIEVSDLVDGLRRGYFTAEVLGVIE